MFVETEWVFLMLIISIKQFTLVIARQTTTTTLHADMLFFFFFALVVSGLGQTESRRELSVHCPPLWCGHSDQTVLQGAARAAVSLGASCSYAQSSVSAQPTGQDGSPPAAVLSPSCKKRLLFALHVRLLGKSFPAVWKDFFFFN